MTVTATPRIPTRTRPHGSHAYVMPVVRELPLPHAECRDTSTW
jgi:hypothetical protein